MVSAGLRQPGWRARFAIGAWLLASSALLGLPGTAGAAITCDFSGAPVLSVDLSATGEFVLIRRSGDEIRVIDNSGPSQVDVPCASGPPTVTTTERVEVGQPTDGQSSQVHVQQFGGAFEPGTGGPAEGAGTDEIEIDLNLGGGFDSVNIGGRPDPEVDHMRFGELGSGNPGVNLNAPETGQPDSDMELAGVDFISVNAGITSDAPNTVDGSGGPEFTGGFPLNMGGVAGGEGADTLLGGDAGGTYDGFGGDDTLVSTPDSDFSETLRGSGGTDTLDYSRATAGVTVDLRVSALQDTGGGGVDILDQANSPGTPDFEDLLGGGFDDDLTGTSAANRIVGAAGTDTLDLLDGDDRFDVMDGEPDTVSCGDGADSGVADVQGMDTIDPDCEPNGIDFPPQTSISGGPGDGARINDPTPSYTVSADEPADFQHRVNGGAFEDCAGTTCTVAALSEGGHALEFRAIDRDDPATPDPTPVGRDVTIDVTPPQTVLTQGPSGAIADPTPSFGFSSEPGASFQCRVDGGAFAACASPHTVAALADGPHSFQVRARDQATNLDPTPASRGFTVDTTAPRTTITRAPKRKVKTRKRKKKARFEFSSDDPAALLECSLDGASFEACSSPFKRKVKKGKHSFEVRGTDRLGNRGEADAHTWKVKRKKKRR